MGGIADKNDLAVNPGSERVVNEERPTFHIFGQSAVKSQKLGYLCHWIILT